MCFIDNASQRISDRSRSCPSLSFRDNQESQVQESQAQSQATVSGKRGCTEIDISLDRLTGNIVDYKVIPKPDDNGITEVLKHE